jgi:RNA polymerase sigma-70 factor (ECF subfamily)
MKLSDVRSRHVQALVDKLQADGLSPSTIQGTVIPLKAIFRRACGPRGGLAVNPTLGLELPAIRSTPKEIVSPDVAAKLLEPLPEDDRAIWATALYAGGPERRAEVDEHARALEARRLYRAAWALCGPRDRAEDLVQDTYARVLSRPRFLRSDDDLGYLLQVLRDTFISQQRAARRRPRLTPVDELEQLADPGVPRPDRMAEARLVLEMVADLPPRYRDVVVAVDVAGLRYDEAARALSIHEGTVATRLFRARKRVAEALA